MTTIDFGAEDALWIGPDLFVTSPEAMETVLAKLREIGYNLKDARDDEERLAERRMTREEREANGWNLWYASLDIRMGKCGSCGRHISTRGIQMHGHTCELCQEVTYLDIVEDTTIRFNFLGDAYRMFGPELRMPAKRWDVEGGWLYLKYEFVGTDGMGELSGEAATAYLDTHAGKWEIVTEDDARLLKIRYHHTFGVSDPEAVIEVRDIWGHYYNHKIIRVWEGEEYGEYDAFGRPLPVPDSFSIHEAWRWQRLEPSPKLHETILHVGGLVSSADYWHQDGRRVVQPGHIERMDTFIRRFTTLDGDAWDREAPHFRMDGPGFIYDTAAFCSPNAIVSDEPNIGNTMAALGKALSGGQTLTSSEVRAAKAGLGDPLARDMFHSN